MTIVLANGCFDVVHAGHLQHLEEARRLGDCLIVGLTVDESVNKGPGFPVFPWATRAYMLSGLRCVSRVVPCSSDVDAILKVRPHLFVKGIDYSTSTLLDPARELCGRLGIDVVITKSEKLSSRAIVDRLIYQARTA